MKHDLILQVPCSCMAGIAHWFFFQKVPNYGNFIITLSLWTTQKNMQLGLHSEWSRHMSKVTLLMNWRPAYLMHIWIGVTGVNTEGSLEHLSGEGLSKEGALSTSHPSADSILLLSFSSNLEDCSLQLPAVPFIVLCPKSQNTKQIF